MDIEWLFWHALLPVIGPSLAAIVVLLIYVGLKPNIKIKEFLVRWKLRRIPEYTGWVSFAITSTAYSLFTISKSTVKDSYSLFNWNMGFMCVCLFLFVMVSLIRHTEEEKEEDRPYTPPSYFIIIFLIIAVVAAFLSYVNYISYA